MKKIKRIILEGNYEGYVNKNGSTERYCYTIDEDNITLEHTVFIGRDKGNLLVIPGMRITSYTRKPLFDNLNNYVQHLEEDNKKYHEMASCSSMYDKHNMIIEFTDGSRYYEYFIEGSFAERCKRNNDFCCALCLFLGLFELPRVYDPLDDDYFLEEEEANE